MAGTIRPGPLRSRAVLAALIGLAAGPALAQGWSAPVALGKTSDGKPSLAMAANGGASVAFGFTGNSGFAVGLIYARAIQGAEAWTKAPLVVGGAYDGSHPGIGQDVSGGGYMVFGGHQFDNYASAYLGCSRNAGAADFSFCGTLTVNGVRNLQPQLRFAGASTTAANTPVYLYDQACALYAGSTDPAYAAVLTGAGECVQAFAFDMTPSGGGAAVFRSTAGAFRAAALRGASGWSRSVTLAPAGTLAPGNVALAAAASGESTAAWTIGKGRTVQVWTATLSAAGAWGAPVVLAADACDPGVAVAVLPGGDVAVVYAGSGVKSACEATVALRPAGGAFAAPQALTAGAKAGSVAAVGTAGGSFVVAYKDGGHGVMALIGTASGFGPPALLGVAGAPVLAAGGGYVNAAWCARTCYATTAAVP